MTKDEMIEQAREEHRMKLFCQAEEYNQDLKSALEKYEKSIALLWDEVNNRLKEIDERDDDTELHAFCVQKIEGDNQ